MSIANVNEMDQSTWVCYQFDGSSYYYGEVGYLDQSGIVLPKDNQQAANNPKNKLVKHGFGVYLSNVNSQTNQPQSKYQGFWDRDEKSGKGSLKLKDGTIYEGNFHQGHYHGQGKMLWSTGQQYEGNWKRSKMDGSGVFKHSSGFVLKGIFKNNYFIDDNVLRNPFLNQKQYGVFKKQHKDILKQKQKQQKVKKSFTEKINISTLQALNQSVMKSVTNNRVPLILSSKTSNFNLNQLKQSLSTFYNCSVNILDLRKLYSLKAEERETYRNQIHQKYRDSLINGEIFILSLDESQVEWNQMFYPDIKEFYEPNGFNSVSWSLDIVKQAQVQRKIIGNNKISQNFKLIVWTKFKLDNDINEQTLAQTLQLKFDKIIPYVKIDSIMLTN